ncbi:hypothetical protein O3G_MSEX007033 [Manduca sexta]|uniref:Secreted protein n=1 Tax=Manduca sexta TaxID=7130 RepID=A0A922CM44_MANSE|nr:hypothetical protein O3G_MSEX007033 [Manduca sexta]
MKYLPLVLLFLAHACECRVASSEESDSSSSEETTRPPLNFPCIFRTLEGESYPSVVVRWRGELQKFAWYHGDDIVFSQDYKYKSASHSYPSSGGLSGGDVVSDPFANAPVINKDYTLDEITAAFRNNCAKPN